MFIFKRSGYYHLEYFDEQDNRVRRISTKSKSKPEALKFLMDFKGKQKESLQNKYISLSQFRDEYYQNVSNTKSKGYIRTVNYSFDKLIKFLSDDIPLSKINVKNIEEFIANSFELNKYGTALTYRTLKSAFNKAINWNYISVNPFVKVKLPKLPKPDPAYINHLQLDSIIEKEKNQDLRDIYVLGFHSGMRLNEIINLKWFSIDFTNQEIKVQNTDSFTTKSKRDRTIPMNQTLLEVLRNRVPKVLSIYQDEYVFNKTKGVKYCQFYVSKKFKKAVIDAGLSDKVHFHSLRHSFISNLVQRGCSLAVVQQLAGHSQISVTMGYAKLRNENLQSAVKLLDKEVSKVVWLNN
jgi:integrase/recombinase XerD